MDEVEEEEKNHTYGVILAMRKAIDEYFEKNELDGVCWNIDIEVYELSSDDFEPLKKVKDYGWGFNRFYKLIKNKED